jgi:hypothetical protein
MHRQQCRSHATRFQALEPIRQRVRQQFGGFGKVIACGPERPGQLDGSLSGRGPPN